jgi:hypothetical protein
VRQEEVAVNCKACNTRFPGSQRVCPNCGHADSEVPFIDTPEASDAPLESADVEPLSPSSLGSFAEGAEANPFAGGEIEFEEEVEMALREATANEKVRTGTRDNEKKSKTTRKKSKAAETRPGAAGVQRLGRAPVSVVIPVDPEQVRHLIVERPEVLEANLSLHVDEEGVEVGAGFETEVGEIDLLARSEDGDFVVAMVVASSSEQEAAVAGMIQRLGWVRKHLSDGEHVVRGVLLTGGVTEELGYAAEALKGSVSFLGWRLSLGFEPLAP